MTLAQEAEGLLDGLARRRQELRSPHGVHPAFPHLRQPLIQHRLQQGLRERVIRDDRVVVGARQFEQECGRNACPVLAGGAVEEDPSLGFRGGFDQRAIGFAPHLEETRVYRAEPGELTLHANGRCIFLEHRRVDVANAVRRRVGRHTSLALGVRTKVDDRGDTCLREVPHPPVRQPVQAGRPDECLAGGAPGRCRVPAQVAHIVGDFEPQLAVGDR